MKLHRPVFSLLTFALIASNVHISSAQNTTLEPSITTEAEISTSTLSAEDELVGKWNKFENNLKRFAKSAVKAILPRLMGSADSTNISGPCIRQGIKLLSGLSDIRPWAVSFVDSSAKTIDGMMFGTMASLGEYDQCVATKAIEEKRGKNKGQVIFTGKYCALDITPPLPPKKSFYKLTEVIKELKNISERNTIISEAAKFAHMYYMISARMGICVPSGCEVSDISQITDMFSERSGLIIKVKRCEVKEERQYDALIIGIISLFSFFGLLLLIGTVTDFIFYYTSRKPRTTFQKALIAFSFITNFKRLVNTDSSHDCLKCFSGLRVLSITWIILAHTYLNVNFQLFRGLRFVTDFPKELAFQAIVNATVAVDTFFFMGGALVCFFFVKLFIQKKKSFNVCLYIIHRIFRLLPVYSMVIAFILLAPLLGYGPMWHDIVDKFVTACHKNWWANLIFINNFYEVESMCLPQSWYISSDMQLYIVALVILLPLLRWPKMGMTIAILGTVASMASAGLITYWNEYPPTMLFEHPDEEQRAKFWSTIYFKPYSHAGPYFVGMCVGYLLATRPNMKFSLVVRIIGWTVAVFTNLMVLYGVWEWNKGVDPSFVETMLYSSLHRVAWSLGVSWVVINCANGQGGVVNYILTWKAWIVLGKLTYAAYLIHPVVQVAAVANIRMQLQPWHWFAVWMYFGHLFITYGCAFAASMLIEAPFLALDKLIFGKLPTGDSNEKPQNGTVSSNSDSHTKPKENGNYLEKENTRNDFISRL